MITDLSLIDLQSQRSIYGYNENAQHFAASVNKLPVTLLVLQDLRAGTLQLDQTLTWTEAGRRGGFGLYGQPGAPLQATVRDLPFDMLTDSRKCCQFHSLSLRLAGPRRRVEAEF